MRKVLMILVLAAMGIAASAADFAYLGLRLKDGSQVFFKADELRFKVVDSKLNVYHAEGTAALAMTDLDVMFFAKEASSVKDIEAVFEQAVDLYTTSGVHLGRFESLAHAREEVKTPGVYLVKSEAETIKIVIGK